MKTSMSALEALLMTAEERALYIAALSTYLSNKLLDKILKDTAFTTSPVYISLHTASPGTTGANETSGGSGPYARQQVTAGNWNAASSEVSSNAAVITFTGMPAATITHVGVWDAVSSGNFLWGGALTTPKTLGLGDTFEITATNLTLSLV